MVTKKNVQVNDARDTGNEIKTTGTAATPGTAAGTTTNQIDERNFWVNVVD